jgi:hypothetical protein
MAETISSIDTDEVSASVSESMEAIQLEIDGRSMRSHEIERAIDLATGAKPSNATAIKNDKSSGGNSLSLTSIGLNIGLAEGLIRLIRRTKDWDSISLTNFLGDRTLFNDLLLACTTHPSVRSLAWRAPIGDGILAGRTRVGDDIHAGTGRISEPTDFSTVHALLYGLKYNSHLTRLEAIGLVLDVNVANLLARALVRNTTLLELNLNGTRFLSESNGPGRADQNHRGTKNATVQTLSFGLRFNRTIESLSLDMCNDLEDEDIACLINAVNSDGTVLRRLSLQETACFDQGMSSIAVLLQENVIEDLNLSYLVRRRRKTPEKEKETQQENQQEKEEEEEQQAEPVEANGEEEEKHQEEATPAVDTETIDKNQEAEQKMDEKPSGDILNDTVANERVKEQEQQQVRNTSLKVLSMAGNLLDDEYLESLLGIFPLEPNHFASGKEKACKGKPCSSQLEELNLLGNRFSNYGIKELLKKLPRFPQLQRLYLGYQRTPPPYGPTRMPKVMFSRMMASNPSLSDRNVQFTPGSLRKEFVAAVSENPGNFRLIDVNVMALTNDDKNLVETLRYQMRLNIGGRKLLASYGKSDDATGTTRSSVPLGLWPLVLDRANRLYPASRDSAGVGETNETSYHDGFHAGDVIYSLLHGPMVFENLGRPPVQR